MRISRFVGRQIRHSRNQALLFLACVALSMVSTTAINGFGAGAKQALYNDARQLHGADIIISANQPFSKPLTNAVSKLVSSGQVETSRIHQFYSMVRTADNRASLLVQIKTVENNYPFYGRVVTGSSKDFSTVLTPGRAVVAGAVLKRLNLTVGDTIRVGKAQFTISDTVFQEPDRPVSFFALGPRVFIPAGDLEALDLVKTGSRVRHRWLLKVNEIHQTDGIVSRLKKSADFNQERINTFATAPSRIKRFFDNLIFFLRLMGIFTLLLAGIGINSTLRAFLREKQDTIAIMKTLGATNQTIMIHFITIVLLLGLVGTIAGILLGLLLQHILAAMLAGLLPPNFTVAISGAFLGQSFLLGLVVVALYTCLPLYRLKSLKPVAIFGRRTNVDRPDRNIMVIAGAITVLFSAMIFWQLTDIKTGFYFAGAALLFLILIGLSALLVLAVLKRLPLKVLAARQAIKGLSRPRNATMATIIAIAASLTVILTIFLVGQNLDQTFVNSYPADAPNLFFIDIQPDQTAAFIKALPKPVPFYPVVRARITTINGTPIDPARERKRRRDNLARNFSLTYRTHLLDDEILIAGNSLFRDGWRLPQVSVLDTVTEMRPMKIGDQITFNIQGVPLTAHVSSIRSRTRKSLAPFFYFVFPPAVLKKAPQTAFAALKIAPENIAGLQNRLASRFPNVSVIDMTATVAFFARQMERLSRVIRFFAVFSVTAGLLILVSAIFATRAARVKEAVYFKILGARTRFISRVFLLENLFLGTTSGLIGLVLAQGAGFMICRFWFELDYHPFLTAGAIMMVMVNILVAGIGWLATRSILAAKPAAYLRNYAEV